MKTATLATLKTARSSYPAEMSTENPFRRNAAALLVLQLDNGAELTPATIDAVCSQCMKNASPGPRVIARIIDLAIAGPGTYDPKLKHIAHCADNVQKLPIALGKLGKAKTALAKKKPAKK